MRGIDTTHAYSRRIRLPVLPLPFTKVREAHFMSAITALWLVRLSHIQIATSVRISGGTDLDVGTEVIRRDQIRRDV